MPRVDIELTSSRADGSWTWRAAGARQPKGSLDGSVLPPGVAVGEQLRAEVEFDVEGPRVVSTTAIKVKRDAPVQLAIVGSGREEPAVTTNMRGGLAGADERRPGRRGRDDGRNGGREGRDGGRGGVGRDGDRRPSAARPGRDRSTSPPGSDRPARPERPRTDDDRRAGARPGGTGKSGPGRGSGSEGWRPQRSRERDGGVPRPPRPPAKRLQPGRVHRDAVLADLGPELRPVAEKVLRGGIAAVRQALDEQNAAARSAGGTEVKADALLGAAEELVPRLRLAEWRDRAEAALASVDEISIRDLRSVVAGSDAARDDDTRTLASTLRDALARRCEAETQAWLDEITSSLADGRVVRALRLSGRPPEPGARMPAEMTLKLTESAGAALSPASSPDRWSAVLEAVIASPVRRSVRPAGLPADADEAFTKSAREAATRVPALAALLGLPAPPPRPAASGPRTPGRPVPPPPPPRGPVKPSAPQPAPEPPAVSPEPTAAEPAAAAGLEVETLGDDSDDAVLVEELGETLDQG